MRQFSTLEKKIIRRIVELESQETPFIVIANILESPFGNSIWPESCFIHLKSPNIFTLFIRERSRDTNNPVSFGKYVGKISSTLLGIVELFEYLDANKLAYFIGDFDLPYLGEKPEDLSGYLACDSLSEDVIERIYPYTRKRIYVSEMLRFLVNKDFKSEDDIRHEETLGAAKRELKYTRTALGIAFLGVLASVGVPLVVKTRVEIENRPLLTEVQAMPTRELSDVLGSSADSISEGLLLSSAKLDSICDSIVELNETTIFGQKGRIDGLSQKLEGLNSEVGELRGKIEEVSKTQSLQKASVEENRTNESG